MLSLITEFRAFLPSFADFGRAVSGAGPFLLEFQVERYNWRWRVLPCRFFVSFTEFRGLLPSFTDLS